MKAKDSNNTLGASGTYYCSDASANMFAGKWNAPAFQRVPGEC